MGRIGQDSDAKSQMVLEICAISTAPIACSHRDWRHCSPVKSPFVDWYRLLGVAEDAGIDVIRKRYHKLALQLHPDKNKHPKAEIAFKLVSEAYNCLSDSARRREFELDRWKHFCVECNRIPHTASANSRASKLSSNSRCCRVVQGLKEIRARFKEEARVIENCLRANSLSRKEYPLFNPSDSLLQTNSRHNKTQKESPIFDPSDYLFHGYPHLRSQILKKPDNLWHLQKGSILDYDRRGSGRYQSQSPIFENVSRSKTGVLNSKSVCIHS